MPKTGLMEFFCVNEILRDNTSKGAAIDVFRLIIWICISPLTLSLAF